MHLCCYNHIMAAKMSIRINEKAVPKQWNLTQFCHNARSRKEKRSGQKRPIPSDCDYGPAPDVARRVMTDEEIGM